MNTKYNNVLVASGAVVFIALIALLLYFGKNARPQSATQESPLPQAQTPTLETKKEITLALKSQNNSGQTGSMNLAEVNGKVLATVNIKKGPANISQPSHIHTGTCEKLSEIKYSLASVVNGFSQTALQTTFEDLQKLSPLAINVHKSNAEAGTYVACANLEFTSIDKGKEATPTQDQP